MEHFLETLMFRSRWLLAPFYLGLVGGLVVLLVKFGQEFLHVLLHLMDASEREVVLALLSLVDITLVANLLLMVIFSGYENFVSKIHTANHEDRPDWMGKVDYSGLKLKLIGSIVAISTIELLKSFMNVDTLSAHHMGWMVGIHLTIVLSGLLFALTDRIAEGSHHK